MDTMFAQNVYETLTGQMTIRGGVPGAENAFAEGRPCAAGYGQVLSAYERLCERLGVVDEDPDVETIIYMLMQNEQELCMKMFRYGVLFQAQRMERNLESAFTNFSQKSPK